MSILTMSIIAKCAFGMTIDKLGEKENPLLEKARRFFSPPENKTASIALVCENTIVSAKKNQILICSIIFFFSCNATQNYRIDV